MSSVLLLAVLAGAAPSAVAAPIAESATLAMPVLAHATLAMPVLAHASPAMPVLAHATPVSAFHWPLDGPPRVVRPFDPPARPWLPGHRGVDLAASPGATVRSAGPGVVLFAGSIAGRGVVSISHRGGLRTTYEPVDPRISVGDRVAAGQAVGVLVPDHPGCRAAACLHWGLRRGEEYLDPLSLVGLGRIRLLPAHAGANGVWATGLLPARAGANGVWATGLLPARAGANGDRLAGGLIE